MLSQLFVFHKSKNFTSDYEIRMPRTVPVNHYSDPEGQHNRIRILWCYPMLMYPKRRLALSTLISSKINQVESIDDYARRANVATTNGIARPALRQSVLKRQPIYHRDLTRHKHQPTFTACTASEGTTDTCGHVSRYNAQLTQNTRQIRIPPLTSTRGRGRNGSSRHTDTAKWVGNTRTTSEHRGPPAQGVHEKGCMLEVPKP
ncbi:hypothetical protein RIF29_02089 [Crotalaria pallida]|uniref:Uncharacterized protein n=1 Tax=Crotalaria pallida TaxID=3830 RepID=A0AAN9IYA2_CROPI